MRSTLSAWKQKKKRKERKKLRCFRNINRRNFLPRRNKKILRIPRVVPVPFFFPSTLDAFAPFYNIFAVIVCCHLQSKYWHDPQNHPAFILSYIRHFLFMYTAIFQPYANRKQFISERWISNNWWTLAAVKLPFFFLSPSLALTLRTFCCEIRKLNLVILSCAFMPSSQPENDSTL